MGIASDVKEEARQKRREKAKAKKATQGRIWTYHPNQTAVAELTMGAMPLDEALNVLSEAVENDVTITIGHKPENSSHYLLARDKAVPWEQANTLSVWHSDIEKAIRTMAYCLRFVAIEFPPNLPGASEQKDW